MRSSLRLCNPQATASPSRMAAPNTVQSVLACPPERFNLRAQMLTAQCVWSAARLLVYAAAKIDELLATGQAAVQLQPGQRLLAPGGVLYLLPLQEKVRSRALELATIHAPHLTSSCTADAPLAYRLLTVAIFSVLWQTLDGHGGIGNGSSASSNVCAWCVCVHCVRFRCSSRQRSRERKPR